MYFSDKVKEIPLPKRFGPKFSYSLKLIQSRPLQSGTTWSHTIQLLLNAAGILL